MDYLPLFYKLRRRRCLVLGEATAADTRARQLAAAGAGRGPLLALATDRW